MCALVSTALHLHHTRHRARTRRLVVDTSYHHTVQHMDMEGGPHARLQPDTGLGKRLRGEPRKLHIGIATIALLRLADTIQRMRGEFHPQGLL